MHLKDFLSLTEILAAIFSLLESSHLLGHATRTCRAFRDAAKDNLMQLLANPQLPDSLNYLLEKRAQQLVSLTLGGLRAVVDDSLVARVATVCNRLEVVDFTGCSKITDTALHHLAAGCPNLHSVNLTKCSVSDAGLTELASRVPLRRLQLMGCGKMTDKGLIGWCMPAPNSSPSSSSGVLPSATKGSRRSVAAPRS